MAPTTKKRERVFLFPSFVPCCPYLNPSHGGSRSYATGHSVDMDVCIRSHELRSGVYAPNHVAALLISFRVFRNRSYQLSLKLTNFFLFIENSQEFIKSLNRELMVHSHWCLIFKFLNNLLYLIHSFNSHNGHQWSILSFPLMPRRSLMIDTEFFVYVEHQWQSNNYDILFVQLNIINLINTIL